MITNYHKFSRLRHKDTIYKSGDKVNVLAGFLLETLGEN